MKFLISAMITLMALGIYNQVQANTQYVFTNDAVFKTVKSGDIKLELGIAIEVKNDNEKNVKGTISGFVYGLDLYSSKNKELKIARLAKKSAKKDGEKIEISGTASKEDLTEIASEVWEEQEEFFFEMCTQCHAAPKVPHHTMIEWEALFGAMRGFAKLDDEESAYLLRYLKSNASNGIVKAKH